MGDFEFSFGHSTLSVVVAAIESGNSKFFIEAGINGYEYLDKIVQMPFAVPLMTDSEKKKLIEGYLNPNPSIKVGRIIVRLLHILVHHQIIAVYYFLLHNIHHQYNSS